MAAACFLSLAYSFHFTLFRSNVRTLAAEQHQTKQQPADNNNDNNNNTRRESDSWPLFLCLLCVVIRKRHYIKFCFSYFFSVVLFIVFFFLVFCRIIFFVIFVLSFFGCCARTNEYPVNCPFVTYVTACENS